MLSKVQNVQESDTTSDESSNAGRYIINNFILKPFYFNIFKPCFTAMVLQSNMASL